ncbi:MAG TPA: GAF domain-containing protein [Ktedonosporobacter sp.]|nr:GAF domain-containing protein [Ktedonosporobacter sp.]
MKAIEGKNGPRTWQELLKQIIEDRKEKERILREIRVRPITLMRWIQGVSKPHEETMRSLLIVLPRSCSELFAHLILVDYPNLALEDERFGMGQSEPPLAFYLRLLHAHATTPPFLYTQALRDLLLQQMIKQFDPGRHGMAISMMCCVPPRPGKKVRSLHEMAGIGTSPWSRNLNQRTLFLGAESLSGTAVTNCRLTGAPGRDEDYLYPAQWIDHEQSIIAYPLMNRTRIAGCLRIASAHPQTFGETHHSLLEHYAYLAALAFEPDAFFDPKDIALHMMPPYSRQEPFFHQFRQRVIQKVAQAPSQRQFMTLSQAQEQVWQELEEELLQLVTAEW